MWFLTHPQVAIDPGQPVTEWGLSEEGRSRAQRLLGAPFMAGVSSVWCSAERKAREAADLIAGDVPVITMAGLGENDRSSAGFVPPDEFEQLADAFFARPTRSVRGWATAQDEQQRIVGAVDELLASPRAGSGDVLIVSHGAVGTLLLCHLLGRTITRDLDQPGQGHVFAFDRSTRAIRFCWRPLEALGSQEGETPA